jgi:N-acetylmuramoyl-L-alanine amidase
VIKYSLRRLLIVLVLGWVLPIPSSFPTQIPTIRLAVEDQDASTRVILSSESPLRTSVEKNGSYLLIRIRTDTPVRIRRESFESRFIDSISWSQGEESTVLNIKVSRPGFEYESSRISDPPRLVVAVWPEGGRPDPVRDAADDVPPDQPPEGVRSEARGPEDEGSAARTDSRNRPSPAQEYRTIVIDPGHGGLETGAVGSLGTREKDITLPLSLKLKAIIEKNLAYRVVLTRDRDVDVPLERRSAIANNERAYVFISIHANGFQGREARGSESFFLSLNATDEEARRLAYLENNSSELEQIEDDEDDAIKMILWDMAQANYLKQSSQLAELIQNELNTLGGTLNRGVKQAPYKVLTGVACPAVLVEIAFLSNPTEERRLLTEEFQNAAAQAIFSGLAKYIRLQDQD